MSTHYEHQLSQADISRIIAGTTTVEEVLGQREAEEERERQQMQEQRLGANPDLSAILRRVEALEEENQALTWRMAMLEARLPLVLDGGRLPPDMSQLECQIFYTPAALIPPDQRRVKTEWSLRLTAWIRGRRAKPDINVQLYPASQFYHQVMERSDRDPTVEGAAAQLSDADDVLAGMLKAITKQKGRPYITSQFCVLMGHLVDNPTVVVVVDGKEVAFEGFRPGKGRKEKHAKWYANVRL